MSFSPGEERKLCVRCGANSCFELIGSYLRANYGNLSDLTVLELDPRSPLRPVLSRAGTYYRTYFSKTDQLGSTQKDGTRCEDITQLTFSNESIDLIISRDVLEHVPNVHAAFSETARVLRPGGHHLFTVPTHTETRKRAEIVGDQIVHHVSPEYHSDPLDPAGILAFWDFGLDTPTQFSRADLKLGIAAGPVGRDQRILWCASKV